MINQLLRADPGVADQLVELGDELRAAAAALDGTRIRELSQARRRLVDTLIRQTLQQAGEEAPSAALREDLTATFAAAVADPQVARELAAGTLLRPVHRADFSPGLPGLALVPPPAKASGETAGTAVVPQRPRAAGKTRPAQPGKVADQPKAAGGAKPTGKARAAEEARAARDAKAAAEAKAAEEARAAEKARAAQERRQVIADAEQAGRRGQPGGGPGGPGRARRAGQGLGTRGPAGRGPPPAHRDPAPGPRNTERPAEGPPGAQPAQGPGTIEKTRELSCWAITGRSAIQGASAVTPGA